MDIDQILQLNDRDQLEAVGKRLTLAQGLAILEHYTHSAKDHWKLESLIVGMQPDLFANLIEQASPEQLSVLKLDSLMTSIQHQLTLISHLLLHNSEELSMSVLSTETILAEIPLDDMGQDELKQYLGNIGILTLNHKLVLNMIERALLLAWHTNRGDIIETLSNAKERCQRSLFAIGFSKDSTGQPSGLFAILNKRLQDIYSFDNHPEHIGDDIPILEGLTKLSVWYIDDYFELGLYPKARNLMELRLDPQKHSQEECHEHDINLLKEAQEKLKSCGLSSVKDLKQAGIFSKKSLQEYLSRHCLK